MSDSPEQVRASLQNLAERFYALPEVQYSVLVGLSRESDKLYFIEQWLYGESSKVMARSTITATPDEAFTCAKAALEAMAVRAGINTPRTEPHQIKLTGDCPENSMVSIDGHNLQSLYSAKFEVDMESQYRVTLGFVAPFAHLDVDVLPQNLTLNVEGLYDCLAMLTALNEDRNRRFADIDYAQTHSGDEEVQMYRDLNALLTRLKPSTPA